MNRELVVDQHIIEAWGLWWVEWQKHTQAVLRKQAQTTAMSTRVNRFAELHLFNGTQEKVLGGVPHDPPAPILPIKNCMRS